MHRLRGGANSRTTGDLTQLHFLKDETMCGIFGFAAKTPSATISLGFLEEIAIDTESRGPHSFGFAWIDSRNRLKMFKGVGRISKHLDFLAMASDAKLLIGHCRYATHGEIDNLNAHPHPCDGGWVVHNGVISNHSEINDEYGLTPVTQCDSETIGMLIEELDGPLLDRVTDTIAEVATSNFAMMGLWKSNPNRMIISRVGKPLHFVRRGSGVYLASRKNVLGEKAKSVKNGSLKSFSHRNGKLVVQSQQVIETTPKPTQSKISFATSRRMPSQSQTSIGSQFDRFGDTTRLRW